MSAPFLGWQLTAHRSYRTNLGIHESQFLRVNKCVAKPCQSALSNGASVVHTNPSLMVMIIVFQYLYTILHTLALHHYLFISKIPSFPVSLPVKIKSFSVCLKHSWWGAKVNFCILPLVLKDGFAAWRLLSWKSCVLFGCLVLVAGTEPGAWNSLSTLHLSLASDLLWLFHHFYLGAGSPWVIQASLDLIQWSR